MLSKISEFDKDGLLFHKIGLVLGAIVGVLFGMFISERADEYIIEETREVESNDTPPQSE